MDEVHLRRIRADLRDMHDSHLAMPPTAAEIAITFYTTEWSHLLYECCVEFYQRLCNDINMITNMITGIIGLSTGRVQESGAAIADRVASPKGKYNNPECSKVVSRYNSRLPLSIITFGTLLDDRIGLL
jgi:hypothetical protein